jgi:hypothetical protein
MGEGSREGLGLSGGLTILRAGPPATLVDARDRLKTRAKQDKSRRSDEFF